MGSLDFEHPVPKSKSPCIENPLDPEELRRQGHMVIDFVAKHCQRAEQHPILIGQLIQRPGYLRQVLPKSAPHHPERIESILQDVQAHILPAVTHRFAYFPPSGSIAGFLGEILATGFNVVGFNWMASPAASELETIVMDWLGEMLQLPRSFLFAGNGGGVLQGTTCEAILCTLVAARDQKLCRIGKDGIGKLVVYGSDQAHAGFRRASRIAGIHHGNFRVIATSRSRSFSLSPDALRSAISSDLAAGLVPLYICATVGTASTTAADPLGPICDVAKEHGIWVHVDAAYAGSMCICPEFRHFISGIDGADSFSLDAHKCFFAALDCCCLWVKDPSSLIRSLSTNPEYLRNRATDSKQVVDYKDWQIALSRRFRAMKLWLVLRSYGVHKLRNLLRSHVRLARLFEGFLAKDDTFELVAPRNFALVCFRVSPLAIRKKRNSANGCGKSTGMLSCSEEKPSDGKEDVKWIDEINSEVLESINGSGRVYMTRAVVDGMFVLRFAAGAAFLSEDSHIVMAWKVVKEHTATVLNNYMF